MSHVAAFCMGMVLLALIAVSGQKVVEREAVKAGYIIIDGIAYRLIPSPGE